MWVVDSNCFIHLGQKGQPTLLKDLKASLGDSTTLHITTGVVREVATVRLQSHPKKAKLLDELAPLLTIHDIDEAAVQGLGQSLGERASPQDVDLSLMVLAAQYQREEGNVMLVSDDFKMTTAAEKVNLGYSTCPPSTFLEILSQQCTKVSALHMRTVSRRVRAAEMAYAISRAAEYNIQAKLTWMVDSLIDSKPSASEDHGQHNDRDSRVISLIRVLRGEEVTEELHQQLGHLPNICAPIMDIDEHLQTLKLDQSGASSLDSMIHGIQSLLSDVLESVGLGLAPLSEDEAGIAHRAMAGSLQRAFTAMGILYRMKGDLDGAKMHLVQALHHATLVADTGAEIRAKQRLAMLAIARSDWQRALSLANSAQKQASSVGAQRQPFLILSGICLHFLDQPAAARRDISLAATLLKAQPESSAGLLFELAQSLMSINRADLAVELIDEAMECAAFVGDDTWLERLANGLMIAESTLASSQQSLDPALTQLLDGLNDVEEADAVKVDAIRDDVSGQLEQQSQPLLESWSDWKDASALVSDQSPLTVVRTIEDGQENLLLVHHQELGTLGLWLKSYLVSASHGDQITLASTRVKLAPAPAALNLAHGVRGIVAIEDPTLVEFVVRQSVLGDEDLE